MTSKAPPNTAGQQAAQNQQQQQQETLPTPVEWITEVMKIASNLSGGAVAYHIANCPFQFANKNDERIVRAVQLLREDEIPKTIVDVATSSGNSFRLYGPSLYVTIYKVCRLFLHFYILSNSPKQALEFLIKAYDIFQQFHTAERQGSHDALTSNLQHQQHVQAQQTKQNNKKSSSNIPQIGWDTAVLVVIVQSIRKQAQKPGALDDGVLGDIIRKWRSLFIYLVQADVDFPNHIARRRGALVVLNCLLSILFHCQNLHQAKTLLNLVNDMEGEAKGDPTRGILGPCGHIRSEVTKLMYFQGRIKLYAQVITGINWQPQQQQSTTSSALSASAAVSSPTTTSATSTSTQQQQSNILNSYPVRLFAQCCNRMSPLQQIESQSIRQNKLRSLFYLCISSILSGVAPEERLYHCDGVINSVLTPIIDAVNSGSPTKLEYVLVANSAVGAILRTRNVFVHCQELFLLCQLVVVKRAHEMVGEVAGEGENSRIDLELMVKSFKLFDLHGKEYVKKDRERNQISSQKNNSYNHLLFRYNDFSDDSSDDDEDFAPEDSASKKPKKKNQQQQQHREDAAAAASSSSAEKKKKENNNKNSSETLNAIVILSNLINKGWVRGYVSYEHQILVLARKDPFPKRI